MCATFRAGGDFCRQMVEILWKMLRFTAISEKNIQADF